MATADIAREASELFGSLQQQMAIMGGAWPTTVTVDGVRYTRRNRQTSRDGELEAVIYIAADGAKLTVFND
jgi:hypothetical protein